MLADLHKNTNLIMARLGIEQPTAQNKRANIDRNLAMLDAQPEIQGGPPPPPPEAQGGPPHPSSLNWTKEVSENSKQVEVQLQ